MAMMIAVEGGAILQCMFHTSVQTRLVPGHQGDHANDKLKFVNGRTRNISDEQKSTLCVCVCV